MMLTGEMPDPETHRALREYLLALADDELIQGHRLSEWCGHAPILEEDIAFANLALDEIGHAALFYGCLADLDGQDPETYPDRLVYLRGSKDYRCAQIVELPNGDWAFSMLRQYLYDAVEKVRLGLLAAGAFQPLAAIAQRMLREELYHHRHTQAWVRRLALGTAESHERMQQALDAAWPYAGQLSAGVDGQERLVQASIAPSGDKLQAQWLASVLPFLKECDLTVPPAPFLQLSRGEHSPYLHVLLAEMQELPRQEPEAEW